MLVYTFASPEDRLIQLSIFWDAYASNRLVVQIAMISHPDRVLIGLSTGAPTNKLNELSEGLI
jgi:hypothetical protein